MRAIAVLAVLLYHLWPSRLPGGFIGVDIFFVISGFLIVGNLLREAETTDRIRLWPFWSRRAKRLLPAALVVLAATTIGILVWLPQSFWIQYLREVIASALYVQNWVLAADSVDYMAQNNTPSPVQHFWTLSVEEQFYIVVPILMVLLILVARRTATNRRRTLAVGLAVVTLASFAFSIYFTATNPPAAYFVTTTRAWEFGLGGLVAFLPVVTSRRWGSAAFLVGALGTLAALLLLNSTVPFPSYTALWPVLAACLMIMGGAALASPVHWLVASRPVQFLGATSYSAYLWHWPLIVILPWAIGAPLTTPLRVAILIATLALAWASTRFIENPVRYSPRLLGGSRKPSTVTAWSAAGIALVVAIAGSGIAVIEVRRAESASLAASVDQNCLGAPAGLDRSCDDTDYGFIIPDPVIAHDDDGNRPECWAGAEVSVLDVCTLGPEDATTTLIAVGDSHNNALISAYAEIATERGWRIDVAGHNGCYWTAAVQVKPTELQLTACEAWKVSLREHLADHPEYDAVVTTNQRVTTQPMGEDPQALEVAGMVDEWRASPLPVIAIRDVPRLQDDIVACVVDNTDDPATACSRTPAAALGDHESLLVAAQTTGVPVVDLTDVFCSTGRCIPVIGGVMAYRDADHVTGTFAATLSGILGDRIDAALRAL